jgi:hypothetical protein
MIEDEFLFIKDWKDKKRNDPKTMKKKLKRTEKEAVRELKKDTIQLQVLREKENDFKRNIHKKTIIRAGNVKDDVWE